jgi:hypothetical protein
MLTFTPSKESGSLVYTRLWFLSYVSKDRNQRVNAVNAFWDCAGDREFSLDWLFRYWSEVSYDLDLWVGCFRKWVLELACDQRALGHVQCHGSGSL